MKYKLLLLAISIPGIIVAQDKTFVPKAPKKLTIGFSLGNYQTSFNSYVPKFADKSNDVVKYKSTSIFPVNSIDIDIIQRNVWYPKFNIYWNLHYSITSVKAAYTLPEGWETSRILDRFNFGFVNPIQQYSVGLGFEYTLPLKDRLYFIPSFSLNGGVFYFQKLDPEYWNRLPTGDYARSVNNDKSLVAIHHIKGSNEYANNYFLFTRTKFNLVYYITQSFGFTLSPMVQIGFNKIDERGLYVIDAKTLGEQYANSSSVARTTSGISLQLGIRKIL